MRRSVRVLISDTYGPGEAQQRADDFLRRHSGRRSAGHDHRWSDRGSLGWRHAFIWAARRVCCWQPCCCRSPNLNAARQRVARPSCEKADRARHHESVSVADYMLVVRVTQLTPLRWGAFGLWGPTFLHRVHGVAVENAGTFFGAVLVVAGLVGTMIGGFAATAWHKRNPAGYAWTLGFRAGRGAAGVRGVYGEHDLLVHDISGGVHVFLFLPTGPVNTLILETVPINLRASAMAVSTS